MRQIIHRHIGVRVEGMILAAGIWMLIALGIARGEPASAPGAWHVALPTWLRVAIWAAPAIIALGVAMSDRWSAWGLGLMQIGPLLHMVSYLSAWAVEVWPGPPPGDPGGWYRASFYAALSALLILLSHIPADVRAPLTGRPR